MRSDARSSTYDMPTVRRIVRESARDNYRFSSIVLGIVRSDPFRMRKVPPAGSSQHRRRRQLSPLEPDARSGEILSLPTRDRRQTGERIHVHHEEASVPAYLPSRRGCGRRTAAARRDGSGVDGAGSHRRRAEAAHGLHVSPARRDHGAVDAGRRGYGLRADADSQAASSRSRSS